ncbi:unnamed protein product, partial [Mesorhabditis belari]|uniref:C-type lectin domain-containing protein n=1 Tax=Mesorhabditis belari TaxID=2138241 RepID=A0AAF3EZR1_9BILA
MFSSQLLMVVGLAASIVCCCPPSCPSGWTYLEKTTSCYKVIKKEGGLDQSEAQALCVSLGSNLTSIHSDEEHDFINDIAETSVNVSTWLMTMTGGVRTGGKATDWKWIDGTPFDYTNWAPKMPDNDWQTALQVYTAVGYPSWDSASLGPYSTSHRHWDDIRADKKFINAVCKRPATRQ